MKAYNKEDGFKPVVLELETQEELDFFRLIGILDNGIPKMLSERGTLHGVPVFQDVARRICGQLTRALVERGKK